MGDKRKMTMQELLEYSKEELAMFILRNNFLHNIDDGMRDVHIQYLLDKDRELTEEEHKKENELFETFKKMPRRTLEEQTKRLKVWEKYKKLSDRNTIAYNKRQKEIDRLLDL